MISVNKGYEAGDITYERFDTWEEETEFIADRIEELIGIGMSLNEIAILIRKNDMAETLVEVLRERKIGCVVENVNKLMDTKEIGASIGIFNYLNGEISSSELKELWLDIKYPVKESYIDDAIRSISKWEPISWKNKHRRNSKSTGQEYIVNQEYLLQQIFHVFFDNLDLKETVNQNDYDLERILFNLGKFTQLIHDFESINYDIDPSTKVGLFCMFLRYSQDQYPEGYLDNDYAKLNGVRIMTVHKSKGLQFSAVFIPGLTKNKFPLQRLGGICEWHFLPEDAVLNSNLLRAKENTQLLEDERRLFYVAVTRSRKFLFLTGALYNRMCSVESTFSEEARDARGYIFEFNKNCYDIAKRHKWIPKIDDDTDLTLNFSILSDYYMCPYKFKLSHIYGFVQPINLRMGYGNSIHNMAKEINKCALNGNIHIDDEQLEKIVEDNFHLPYIGTWQSTKQVMIDNARECIESYIKKNQKDFKDIQFVEKYIELEIGKNILVAGRIDLVLKRDVAGNVYVYIIDYKTSENSNTKLENKIQTNIYSLGYKGVMGSYPNFVEIINIEKNKIISTEPVDIKELNATVKSIQDAAANIRENKLQKQYDSKKCKDCHKKDICLTRKEKDRYIN